MPSVCRKSGSDGFITETPSRTSAGRQQLTIVRAGIGSAVTLGKLIAITKRGKNVFDAVWERYPEYMIPIAVRNIIKLD